MPRVAYSDDGKQFRRCGEHHHLARYTDAVVRAVLTDYQEHAIYPVEIARARGIPYNTVKKWVYSVARCMPVDHYEDVAESPLPSSPARKGGIGGQSPIGDSKTENLRNRHG